ncbi:MAG: TlpA family protein disulfide reductase [Flavobacteriales bacterium]
MKKSKIILILFIGLAGVGLYWYYRIPPSIDFKGVEFMSMNNERVPFDSLQGEKVVMHFYARWCGPCLREMKDINAEAKNLSTRGIKIFAISDDGVGEMKMMASQSSTDITFLHVKSLEALGIHSIPTTYLLSHGETILKQNGLLNWDKDIFPAK